MIFSIQIDLSFNGGKQKNVLNFERMTLIKFAALSFPKHRKHVEDDDVETLI